MAGIKIKHFSRSLDDITELQCCTLRERCQSPPSDANSLSAGHLALLRSRHHSVTTYPFRSGCSYADGRRSARRRATHLLLRASPAGHTPTGADISWCSVEAAGHTESRVKTNCSHGDAYISRESAGIGAWAGFHHCAAHGGTCSNKWLQ